MKRLMGSKAWIFFDTYDPSRTVHGAGPADPAVNTVPGTWHFIVGRGAPSGLPAGFPPGALFRSPKAGAAQLVLGEEDRVMPIDPRRFCKTSADFSIEQGSVDVGDDCEPGASILDGIIKISGSFSGFMQEDPETGEFTDITAEMLNRYLDIAEDNGEGGYAVTPKTADEMFLLLNLNAETKAGQREKWLLTPIILPSLSSSAGLTDALNMDISWQQGSGTPLLYIVPKVAL